MSNQIASEDNLLDKHQHEELYQILYGDLAGYDNTNSNHNNRMKMNNSEVIIEYADKSDSSQNNRIAIHHDYYKRIYENIDDGDEEDNI